MGDIKAVIFDIDGTLTPQISWTAFTRDIGGSVTEHLTILEDHLRGKMGLDESRQQFLKLWQETGKATKQHIDDMLASWPIRPEAQGVVNQLHQQGLIVCLITGSLSIYAQTIAARLDIENYYANADLYFDEHDNLVDFHYVSDQASVKVAQLKEFCTLFDLQYQECMPVGDSTNDIGLFLQTGNGVLLDNGDPVAPELRAAAWKITRSLTEVPDLVLTKAPNITHDSRVPAPRPASPHFHTPPQPGLTWQT